MRRRAAAGLRTTQPAFEGAPTSSRWNPEHIAIALATGNVALYTLMALAQWIGWGGLAAAMVAPRAVATEAVSLGAVNVVYGLVLVAVAFLVRPMRLAPKWRYPVIAAMALVVALPRAFALLAVYTTPSDMRFFMAEWLSGFVGGALAVGGAVLAASFVARAQAERARWQAATRRAQLALADLQAEEVRVRRMVADQLHGNLQFQLVGITAAIDVVASQLRDAGDAANGAELEVIANALDGVREREVRALSQSVFPSGIELGALPSIQAIAGRVPPQIKVSVATTARFDARRDVVMPLADRLAVVFAVEEAVTNALKHGQATEIAINLDVRPANTTIDDDGGVRGKSRSEVLGKGDDASDAVGLVFLGQVENNGVAAPDGFEAPAGSTLARYAEQFKARGGSLALQPGGATGSTLSFALPFTPSP